MNDNGFEILVASVSDRENVTVEISHGSELFAVLENEPGAGVEVVFYLDSAVHGRTFKWNDLMIALCFAHERLLSFVESANEENKRINYICKLLMDILSKSEIKSKQYHHYEIEAKIMVMINLITVAVENGDLVISTATANELLTEIENTKTIKISDAFLQLFRNAAAQPNFRF